MTTHGLEVGSLDLTSGIAHADGYTLSVLGEEMTLGASQARVRDIVSKLADGDLVSYDGAGNRVVSFPVLITGPDGVALQAGEVALRRELYRPNTVTWTPPSDFSAPTVFEVLTSEMVPQFDDIDELRDRRVFLVTLTCLPFARSLEPVTVAPLAVGTTRVEVDSCDVTTGWTGTRNGAAETPTTFWEAGAVQVAEFSSPNDFPPETWTLTRTGSVDFTATPYLEVEVTTLSAKSGAPFDVEAFSGGTALPMLNLRKLTDGSGYFRAVFDATLVGASSSLTFTHTSAAGYGHAWQGLFVRNIARSNVAPGVTVRQTARIVNTGGTERTPASIHVQSANGTDALTTAIVHTCPNDGSGYSPPLRRWRTVASTGPVTTDATTLSGGYEPIAFTSGGFYAEVPTSALPEGGYTLLVRVRLGGSPPAAVTVFYSTSTIFPSGSTQEGFTNGSTTVTLSDTNWALVPVAVLSLPSVRTIAGKVQVVLQTSTTHAQVYLDEAWLFRVDDDCALSIIKTPRPHAWLDSPDAGSPVPTVWVGDGATTRVHPGEGLMAQGAHVLSSDGTAVFVAALTDNPATDATFYRRWHSNAAD